MAEKEIKDFHGLVEKVNKAVNDHNLDLSSDEDLSIGVMNLISIEEHLFFTAQKTGKPEYYKMLHEVREMRKSLLGRIIKDYEGEVWCISKHLLAASMRLMEVGTKALTKGNQKDAEDLFTKAYDLYALFWAINLKMIDAKGVDTNKVLEESRKEGGYIVEKVPEGEENKPGFLSKFRTAMEKALNCCKE